jgi:hypothetical protein
VVDDRLYESTRYEVSVESYNARWEHYSGATHGHFVGLDGANVVIYGCWFWHSKLAQCGGLSWPTLGQSELYPVSQ